MPDLMFEAMRDPLPNDDESAGGGINCSLICTGGCGAGCLAGCVITLGPGSALAALAGGVGGLATGAYLMGS